MLENNTDYSIVTDREISTVLSHFSPEMIRDVIENVLEDRVRPYSYSIGNLVSSYETNFRIARAQYPNYAEELENKRLETYEFILNKVCEYHSLSYAMEPNTDIYTAAVYTYQFLVSDYKKNIVSFFTNYILKEKNSIYDSLNLAEFKKNKDSSSIYSKKVYKGVNPKLLAIHANLNYVLEEISAFDIDLNVIIDYVYTHDKQLSRFLQSFLGDNGDFYHNHFMNVINGPERPELITNIRLQLQPNIIEMKEYLINE